MGPRFRSRKLRVSLSVIRWIPRASSFEDFHEMRTRIRFRKRVANRMFALECKRPARLGRATGPTHGTRQQPRRGSWLCLALKASLAIELGLVAAGSAQQPQQAASVSRTQQSPHQPPRVREAEHFLTLRGWTSGHRLPPRASASLSRSQKIPSLNIGQNPSGSANSHQPLLGNHSDPLLSRPQTSVSSPDAFPQSPSILPMPPAIDSMWAQPAAGCGLPATRARLRCRPSPSRRLPTM
jgi:hypothetical protein